MRRAGRSAVSPRSRSPARPGTSRPQPSRPGRRAVRTTRTHAARCGRAAIPATSGSPSGCCHSAGEPPALPYSCWCSSSSGVLHEVTCRRSKQNSNPDPLLLKCSLNSAVMHHFAACVRPLSGVAPTVRCCSESPSMPPFRTGGESAETRKSRKNGDFSRVLRCPARPLSIQSGVLLTRSHLTTSRLTRWGLRDISAR